MTRCSIVAERGTLGIDTNVMISGHLPGFAEHASIRSFLLGRLADPEEILVVTPMVLHEFVHVVTDARRFDPPVEMAEALAVAGGYLDRTNVTCVAVDEESTALAFELMNRHRLGRRRVADTLLAATLLRHGVNRFATCNQADFEIFDGLELVDPRAAG
jgi:predicted nucleic acid-binding protein